MRLFADEFIDRSCLPGCAMTLTATHEAGTSCGGGGPCTFTLAGQTTFPGGTPNHIDAIDFSSSVGGTLATGSYSLAVSWRDVAGNDSVNKTVPTALARLRLLLTTPSPMVDQTSVRYLRSPFGNDSDELMPGFYPFGRTSVFQLAPADPTSLAANMPGTTFQVRDENNALVLPKQVRVHSGATGGFLMGSMTPSGGSWPRANLAAVQTPTVYVTLVDDAGNESGRTRIQKAEWVVTARNEEALSSNHLAIAMPQPVLARSPLPEPSRTVSPIRIGGSNRENEASSSSASWSVVRKPTYEPQERYGAAAAFDLVRGRTVLYGGTDEIAFVHSDTSVHEWDGQRWEQRLSGPVHPAARYGATMAFDAVRGKTLLFGGRVISTNVLTDSPGSGTAATGSGASPRPLLRRASSTP